MKPIATVSSPVKQTLNIVVPKGNHTVAELIQAKRELEGQNYNVNFCIQSAPTLQVPAQPEPQASTSKNVLQTLDIGSDDKTPSLQVPVMNISVKSSDSIEQEPTRHKMMKPYKKQTLSEKLANMYKPETVGRRFNYHNEVKQTHAFHRNLTFHQFTPVSEKSFQLKAPPKIKLGKDKNPTFKEHPLSVSVANNYKYKTTDSRAKAHYSEIESTQSTTFD